MKVRIKIDSDETNLKAKLLLHPKNVDVFNGGLAHMLGLVSTLAANT